MTAPAGLASLFPLIPTALIASSAIFLDHVIRYEKLLQRCQVQIWMWIALSLVQFARRPETFRNDYENTNENTSAYDNLIVIYYLWAHLTIFFNLAAIVGDASQSSLIAPSKWKQSFRNTLQILPISSWWSMIVVACSLLLIQTTNTATESSQLINSSGKLSIFIFLGSFFVYSLVRLSANRRRKMLMDMQGMPTTMTTNIATSASDTIFGGGIMARFCGVRTLRSTTNYKSSVASERSNTQLWLDERQWYKWTRVQVIQWFAEQLSSKTNGCILEDEKDMILAFLVPHRITGDVLEDLADVSQLVALQVPFGPACRLSDSIVELVGRYPKPQRMDSRRRRTKRFVNCSSTALDNDGNCRDDTLPTSNDCLDLHDHQYNNETRSRQLNGRLSSVNDGLSAQCRDKIQDPSGQFRYQSDSIFPDNITVEQHEKLNNVMKERFGLELPNLKAADVLAVHKGLESKPKNNQKFKEYANDDILQSHPLAMTNGDGSIDPTTRHPVPNGITYPESPSSSLQNIKSQPLNTSIPENILNEMPPEIQEVAKRRPDLMMTIWRQKQQQILQQPRKQNALPVSSTTPSIATKQHCEPSKLPKTSREEHAVEEYSEREYYDSDDQDETTSLIHRENSNEFPARYKSIDKSLLPGVI